VIRILMVEDHASFRMALAFMFQRESDLRVVGEASSLAEARGLLTEVGMVDVAIVDLDLPDGSGAGLVRELRATNPEGMVLILTASHDRREWGRAVESGAGGVLHKSTPPAGIISAIRRLSAGEWLLAPNEMRELLRHYHQERERTTEAQYIFGQLTPRELEVLQALAEALDDDGIAQRLHISPATARTHVTNLLRKLRMNSRLEAVVCAVRHGIVQIV
jgi:DNA-binding NarL/FixJ family response regulator